MTLKTFLCFLATVITSMVGQALLKQGISREGGLNQGLWHFLRKDLWAALFTFPPLVVLGAAACGLGAVFWLYILSFSDLSRALPMLAALAFIAMFLVGRLWLHEPTSWLQALGIATIILGIFLVLQKPEANL